MKSNSDILNEMYLYLVANQYIKSQKDLADAIDGNETTISQSLRGDERYATINLIKRINKAFGNIFNTELIQKGDGKMLKSDNSSLYSSTTFPSKPFINSAYAECGKPGGFSLCVKKEDCEMLSIPFIKDYDFSITATGDSMINRKDVDRSIASGDIVQCKIAKSRSHVRFGEVYALSTLDGFTIKKVVPSDKDGFVKCVPFNTEDNFFEFDLPVEEIYDWAFVVSVVRINRW